MKFSIEYLNEYVRSVLGTECKVLSVETLAGAVYTSGEIKGYGYGEPLLLNVECKGIVRKYVLNTVRPGQFGHEYMSDRAAILIWNHMAFNNLPRHVKSIDLGYFTKDGRLVSINNPVEFFQLVEYVEGVEYRVDLERIAKSKKADELDFNRAKVLAEYIADIHSVKKNDPQLYRRRIRELLGHGEMIMGLIDSYSGDEDFLKPGELKDIEHKCIEWRWKLRDKSYRLSRVHGDFHPWNVKFREGLDFTVLDRSRGEWGEPADDITAMSINYLFFSLMFLDGFKEPFRSLWNTFIDTYLDKTGDEEILKVVQPFYAFRGLVIANPLWYPNLKYETRRAIFNFINNVLDTEYFDYKNVEGYLTP